MKKLLFLHNLEMDQKRKRQKKGVLKASVGETVQAEKSEKSL